MAADIRNTERLSKTNRSRQVAGNDDVHQWYDFILGYTEAFVGKVIDKYLGKRKGLVVDPFCGSGTTLVAAMRRGLKSAGFDASPFACFVSRAKTSRSLSVRAVAKSLNAVEHEFLKQRAPTKAEKKIAKFLKDSGMLKRGWISHKPMADALRLRTAIETASTNAASRSVLLLALASLLPTEIGNMRYGPSIYCGKRKTSVDIWSLFRTRVREMIADVALDETPPGPRPRVVRGDARKEATFARALKRGSVAIAIGSPPYPTEHDYTRHTRLELIILGYVKSDADIRRLKQQMIRSHTKGVYKQDTDGKHVENFPRVQALAARIDRKGRGNTDGFARQYPKVIRHYFGGMKRHLSAVHPFLKKNGKYILLVGDQASYHGVPVPTAQLIGEIAKSVGYVVHSESVWRERWASKSSRMVAEKILVLRKRR